MQYHLNGYTFGDPSVAAAAPEHIRKDAELPETVDVLVVGTGPAGAVLTAQLAQYPELSVATVDRRGEPLARGHADGVACRTVEMFEAFGLADTLVREALWVNETAFWSVENPGDGITRTGLVQDVADGLSEFPHVIVNQARMQELLFDVAAKSPSRFEVDYGWQYVSQTIDESEEHPVEVTLEATAQEHAEKHEPSARNMWSAVTVPLQCENPLVANSTGMYKTTPGASWTCSRPPTSRMAHQERRAVGRHGQPLMIPREGGNMVRCYVDLGDVQEGDSEIRSTSAEELRPSANAILYPYRIDVKQVAWSSVYEVGQRVADRFDDLSESSRRAVPHLFVAGDACHTHSAKAGQGMNVSMQDAFNLGWKLAAVLSGQAKPELLHTYSEERKVTAQELIDYDIRGPKWVGSRDADQPVTPDEVEEQFVRGGQFTAGLATRYTPDFSTLTGPDTHQDLAAGFEIGTASTRHRSFGSPMQNRCNSATSTGQMAGGASTSSPIPPG